MDFKNRRNPTCVENFLCDVCMCVLLLDFYLYNALRDAVATFSLSKSASTLFIKMMRIIRTPRTSVFVRVSQTLQVTIFCTFSTSPFTPRTSVFVRVFQTLELTIFVSISTSFFIPRTSVFKSSTLRFSSI